MIILLGLTNLIIFFTDYGCTVRTMRELREGIVKITKDFSEECGYNRKVAAVPMDVSNASNTSTVESPESEVQTNLTSANILRLTDYL